MVEKRWATKTLHSMNKTRMLLYKKGIVNRYKSLKQINNIFLKKLLDLGCGGGILSESLQKKEQMLQL